MPEKPAREELEQRIRELENAESENRHELEALRESEAMFRFLTESMSDIVWTVDMDFNTTYVSPSIENVLGFTPEERKNQSPEEMVTPESLKSIKKLLNKEYIKDKLRSKDRERSITAMTEYYMKSGGTLWLENHVRWIRDEKGKIIGIHGISRDITARRQAEKALKESEEQLKLALKGGDLGTWNWNIETDRIDFNERWAEMKGYSIDEIEPHLNAWKKLVHPDDLPGIYEILNRHLEGKTDFYEAEFRMRHETGNWVWILDRGKIIERDNKGNPLRVCGTHLDITDRKRIEEELRTSEERYRSLVEHQGEGIAVVNPEEQFIFANPAAHDIFGVSPGGLVGRNLKEFLDEEGIATITSQTEMRKTRKSSSYELEIIRPDGQISNLLVTVRPQFEQQQYTGAFGIFRNITKRKQAEKALKESEERYRTFINSTSDLVFLKDSQFKYLVLNKTMADFYGKSFEEVIGMSDYDLLPEEAADICRASDRNVIATGKIITTEEHFGENSYEAIKFPVALHNGKTGVGCFMRDITEFKRTQENSQKLLEQLHQSQKLESVGRLAGGVAHDFNNMLCVILGHLEMIQEELPSDSSIRPNLEEIHKASRHSTDIVSQLLAFARKQTISPRVLDLNETVGSMLKMLKRLIGEDIDLSWQPARGLWPVRLDSTQIDQILTNLCINARDAIDGVGNLTIKTDNLAFDEDYCDDHHGFIPGEYVMMSVSDDGCGMDEEIEKNIFEPFFTTKEVGKGTGLGLSTVYGIVRQNEGFVNVYSEPGQGACISIYLPRHFTKITSEPQKDSEKPAVRGSETILLVEDEPAILEMIATILERLGYTVLSTDIPGEAIRLAREYSGNIHLLMTDVVMPEMNGRDLARNLLSIYPDIKRLFMSGYTANVIAHHGVLDEGVLFIQKPFTSKELAVSLREALDKE